MVFEISPPETNNSRQGGGGYRYGKKQQSDFAFKPGELPHDLDTEKAVLSGVLVSNDVISELQSIVKAIDFFSPAHQKIFTNILELAFKNTPIDLTTLSASLRDKGELDYVGGSAYLSEIYSTPSTSDYAIEYAKIVKDLSWRRKLLIAAEECKNLALKTGNTREIASKIEKKIFSASQEKVENQVAKISDVLEATIKDFEHRVENRDNPNMGVRTGLDDVDKVIGGFRPGQLIVLAAGSGVGKTSLALNIVTHSALKQNKRILFFSLEMTKKELTERLLSAVSGVDAGKIRKGLLEPEDFNELYYSAEDLGKSDIYIDDRSVVSPFDVLAQARRSLSQLRMNDPEANFDLIVCDYIQIMTSGGRHENRSLEVAAITGGLKVIAKELEVPVIALSQLNRNRDKRTGTDSKKPGLSDLRDSGAIEQDADIVMFIYREASPEMTDSRSPAEAELIIAKHRGGPTANIKMTWLGHLTKYVNYMNPEYHNEYDNSFQPSADTNDSNFDFGPPSQNPNPFENQ